MSISDIFAIFATVFSFGNAQAFDIFRDQADALPVGQLGDAIRALGLNPTEVQVMEMVNKYDTNADGKIDLEEWTSIVQDLLKLPKDDRNHLKEAFEIVAKDSKDASGHASISTDELVYVTTQLGTGLSADEVKQMVEVVDANKDGSVQFHEFVSMVQKLPAYGPGEDSGL